MSPTQPGSVGGLPRVLLVSIRKVPKNRGSSLRELLSDRVLDCAQTIQKNPAEKQEIERSREIQERESGVE